MQIYLAFLPFFRNFAAMKLSVVIPVYRVEATLDRCVESVLAQDIEGMEVILVDDGSPDQCPAMCDAWAQKDSRIRVVHKQNGGLSDARNTGIDLAQGDHITFVDSDDWVEPGTFAALMPLTGDNDIVEYPVAERLHLEDRVYQHMEEYWLQEKAYAHTYACNKIYRKELFKDIRYPKGRIFEDVYTLPLLLRQTKRIATTAQGCYHYTWNPEGITATADGHGLAQLLEANLQNGMPMDDLYYMYLVNIQIDVWERIGAPIQLPHRKVSVHALPGRYKLKAMIQNTFGIKILCRIFKTIHLIRRPSRL